MMKGFLYRVQWLEPLYIKLVAKAFKMKLEELMFWNNIII